MDLEHPQNNRIRNEVGSGHETKRYGAGREGVHWGLCWGLVLGLWSGSMLQVLFAA